MTAGQGIQHAEMFPLIKPDAPNPLQMYQIWLNLPAKDKMCPPAFAMFWSESMPSRTIVDDKDRKSTLKLIAGDLPELGLRGLPPPPNSWASDPEHDVLIIVANIAAGSSITLPASKKANANRAIYVTEGASVTIGSEVLRCKYGAKIDQSAAITLTAQDKDAEVLLLQGVPIGEPVAQHGPFVMNTSEELAQAFSDFRKTNFGQWKWGRGDPVHAKSTQRHCVHPDGRKEQPPAP